MSYWLRWKRRWRVIEKSRTMKLVKRRFRQLYGRELRHFVDVRVPRVRCGDWEFTPARFPERGGLAYSLGVGEDADLDLLLIERFGFEVHAFDPTPRAIAWVKNQNLPPGFHFHPVGIAGHDGTAEFTHPGNPKLPSFRAPQYANPGLERITLEVRKITTLARQLGHNAIDLLKIDIEGAEYAVIDDVLRSDLAIQQILVEFHHRFKGIGRERTAHAVKALRNSGYRITSISPSGQEYAFIRSPGSAA